MVESKENYKFDLGVKGTSLFWASSFKNQRVQYIYMEN